MADTEGKVVSGALLAPACEEGADIWREFAMGICVSSRGNRPFQGFALGDDELELAIGLDTDAQHGDGACLDVELDTRTTARFAMTMEDTFASRI